MQSHSDLEELLEETERPQTEGKRSFPSRFLVILGVVGLSGLAVLSFRGKGLRSNSKAFVSFQEADDVAGCFDQGMYYANPAKLPGTERTVEMTPELCQQRCQVVDGCAQFTFWPDGGCLLTGEGSTLKSAPAKYAGTMHGPKFCQSAIDAANAQINKAAQIAEVANAGDSGLQPLTDDTSGLQPIADAGTSGLQAVYGASGLQEVLGSSPKLEEQITAAAGEISQMLPGVNGTSCSKYPACVAAGMLGECCPNAQSMSLGCCNGFPKAAAVEVKVAPGAACSAFRACAALNMTGACCPTATGIQLGCCSQI